MYFFLSEETEAILTKHLLKTVCSDITNIVVNVLGHEHMLSNSEEEENFTPEVCIWSTKGCGGGVGVSVKRYIHVRLYLGKITGRKGMTQAGLCIFEDNILKYYF